MTYVTCPLAPLYYDATMSYKALLFCPEEKTARIVTQVLTELEFRVELCNEPFAAVKKLMAEHFDAIVVDCDNEQNATLLFKSAHNSGSNQSSLAVAVVEGQAGVAKAFRIGANLVLTKPINVEQSKGTLRVARGLLRKTEISKPAGASSTIEQAQHLAPHAEFAPTASPEISGATARIPSLPTQPQAPTVPVATASVFEKQEDPAPKPEPTEAALLESMPDPITGKKLGPDAAAKPAASRQYPWQPVAKPMAEPMASALRRAAEAAGKSEPESDTGSSTVGKTPVSSPSFVDAGSGAVHTASPGFGQHGAATAPAPAKEAPSPRQHMAVEETEAPLFSSIGSTSERRGSDAGGSKKAFLIVAAVVLVATAGYIGWTKMHPRIAVPTVQRPAAPVVTQPLSPAATAPTNQGPSAASPALPSQPTNSGESSTVEQGPDITLSTKEAPASASQSTKAAPKSGVPTTVSTSAIVAKPVLEAKSPERIVVKNEVSKPAAQSASSSEPIQPPAPDLLSAASNSSDAAISGIVSAPTATVSQAPPQTLKISQGVAQGLLVKKVPPVYPEQARQLHLHGAVQLLASISKNGDITAIKVISGDRILAHAAADAVKQWKYRPYLLDGQPVEIQTQVTVNFTLP